MPRKRKSASDQPRRLDTLPRDPSLVIEGGVRPLGVFVRENKRNMQPRMALWLDGESGVVRANRVIAPSETGDEDDDADMGMLEALEALQTAMTGPFTPALPLSLSAEPLSEFEIRRNEKQAAKQRALQPGLPGLVRVNDERLAEAARALIEPLGVSVEYVEDMPAFEDAFSTLSEAMGASPDATPPEPFAWDIDAALVPPLFKAAAGLWRRAPWEYLPDHPPIAVELGPYGPQDETQTMYVSVLGGAGEVLGLALYYSAEGLRRTLEQAESLLDEMEESSKTDAPSVDILDAELDQMLTLLRQSGFPIDMIPPEQAREVVRDALVVGMGAAETSDTQEPFTLIEDALTLFFESAEEIDPTYLEWLDERRINYSSRDGIPQIYRMKHGAEPSAPTARETRAVTLVVEAINQFVSAHNSKLDSAEAPNEALSLDASVALGSDKIPVRVVFPAPGFTFEEFLEGDDDDDEDEDDSMAVLDDFDDGGDNDRE